MKMTEINAIIDKRKKKRIYYICFWGKYSSKVEDMVICLGAVLIKETSRARYYKVKGNRVYLAVI